MSDHMENVYKYKKQKVCDFKTQTAAAMAKQRQAIQKKKKLIELKRHLDVKSMNKWGEFRLAKI